VGALRADSARQLTFDPVAGLAGITPGDETELAAFGAHRAHQRCAQPRDSLAIERELARLSANAISTEESEGHKITGNSPEISAVGSSGSIETI
jgi:hypothetical protein